SGIPVLLIHGWSQAYMCWSKQYNSERMQKFRMVAFDLRGHGMSDAPLGDQFYNDSQLWAEDVHAVLTGLQLEKAILVGWSYGGLVMTDYVRSYGDEAISGINFVGAAIQLNEAVMGTMIGPGFLEHFEGATSEDKTRNRRAMEDFLEDCFSVPLEKGDFEQALKWNLAVRPDVRLSLASRDVDASAVVGKINVPTLITQGLEDKTVLPAMAESITTHAKNCSASWYEGVAHAPFLEDTERFNKELEEFVISSYND
ncbi:MAG: alpha/beta hydrolase, partial [Pseudomonadota bacterium]|nr:alpha/beta hydrolase [Pseudomonadota bacterium]